jgi:hypothetical protein
MGLQQTYGICWKRLQDSERLLNTKLDTEMAKLPIFLLVKVNSYEQLIPTDF